MDLQRGPAKGLGAYLHFKAMMEKRTPQAKWKEISESLDNQFRFGYLDSDLVHCVSELVPPGDLNAISAFRLLGSKYDE